MDINIATWNIRGLGKASKQKEIRNLIRNEKLNICAILVTHMEKDRIDNVCNNIFRSWLWQCNIGMSKKGCRIAIGWDANYVKCTQLNITEQSMLYHVEVLSTQQTLFCTFIYAANKGRDRKKLWKDLNLKKRVIGNASWVIMGDVNVSLHMEDHSEGMSNYTQDMIDFQECINSIEVEDIKWFGLHFTWIKSLLNCDNTILKNIDRIMCNNPFLAHYSNASALFLPYGIYDHNPTILKIPHAMRKINKSFRLANYVANKANFKKSVKDKWGFEVHGYAMYKLVKKLKNLKPHLNELNWENGNLFEKVIDLKAELYEIQSKIGKNPTNKDLRRSGVEILKAYKEAIIDEEKLLRQKTKITWLSEADKNSTYFHKVLRGRINRSRIMSFCDENGTRYENYDVADQLVKHFEGFLGISPAVTKLNDADASLFEKKVKEEDASYMIKEVTEEEIKPAVFDITDDKAPGPDGFTFKFFKKSWGIIKQEFCAAVKELFVSGKLLRVVNDTLISLIPKSLTPQKVSDYRPIACCNVVYKCISKILTNRIKKALSYIVDDNQSAFVLRRAITDNILLT
ncbi:RNA-directed DNA polymerase, eukaryota, reverse transcriptase zinc-binding domain protein [Tanacetum coccineum]